MDLQRISELGFENISMWHKFVLVLSFGFLWNAIVIVQCMTVFLLSTSKYAFSLRIPNITYILTACDILYLMEVIFTLSYCRNKRLKKLKYAKSRHWIFLIVDFVSLVPVELMFTFHYINDNKNHLLKSILAQNRSLRVYRLFLLEWFYMSTIRTTWKYVAFTFLLFVVKSLVIGHVLSCIWYNIDKASGCNSTAYNCYMWHEVHMLNVIMLNWVGPVEMFSETGEAIIVMCAMIAGFLLIFSYIYPYTFYFSMLLGCKDSIFFEKRKRLSKYLSNRMTSPDLRLKIINYFNYMWMEGEEDIELESLLSNIPLGQQKELLTDIYWEAFRHSDLLRATSRSFKRSLSLHMTTEYHQDGEVIYYKGQRKGKMMYLVQGILQVMAEENENSPLLSFSSGTVFGEFSIFFSTESRAIVKCKGYCELQILHYRDLLNILKDYPKDRKLIFDRLNDRVLLSKYTQWRKRKFKEEQKMEMLSSETSYFTVVDCVKWLKVQWRNTWEGHKRHKDVIKAKAEGTRLSSWRMPVRPDIKIEFISNYLDLVVLSNLMEEKKGFVCLQSKFPWSIDPSTSFLKIWRFVILLVSLVPTLAYPVSTSWFDRFPIPVYHASYLVTLLFMVDVVLKLLTAVQTKHATITKFSQVLRRNLQTPTFYFDVISAVPYQIFIIVFFDVYTVEAYKVGLLLHPAIFKFYVFIGIKPPLGNFLDILILLKNCIIYFLLVYGLAEIVQLDSVRGVFGSTARWIDILVEDQVNKEFLKWNFVSVFKALVTAISVPSNVMYSENNLDMVLTCMARYLFFVFSCYFMGSYYAHIVVKSFGSESFRVLMDRLKNFLASKNVSEKIVSRVVKCIKFQWIYDKADFIASQVSILNSMPYNIRRQVYFETTLKTLQRNPFFADEPVEFLLEVLEDSDSVAVPPGLVLVTYGHTSHILILINRGFCQLNSHLVKDVNSNLGKPIILGPSCAFPLLSSFCNVPSPISVVTITDCELIVMDLNKLIGLLMKYNIFKDVVELINEVQLATKLMDSRPALMKICAFETGQDESDLDVREFMWLKRCCYVLLKRVAVFVTATLLKYWPYFYMCYLLIDTFLWPCCFGLLVFQFHIIMPLLIAMRIFGILHIVIHAFMPYFNRDGLMITHPWHTFLNYLSSSFALDAIHLFPVFPIYYYGFCDPEKQPNVYVTVITTVQHFVGLNYLRGCIGYIGSLFQDTYYNEVIKVLLTFTLIFNMYVNMCMFVFADWTFGGPHTVIAFGVERTFTPPSYVLLRRNNVWDYYLYVSYWVLNTMTTNEFDLHVVTGLQLYMSYFQGFLGTLISYYLFVTASSASKFANLGGAAFREEFVSLLKYLEYEKTEDKTIERVKLYYKYIWTKSGGENMKEIFGRLPLYLLEELWYPMYRPTFVKNGMFEEADEGFFRILSTHVSSVFFTRGSLIIFKDESQSFIYFLHRGKCFVYDWFMILDIGSIVGDLHQTGVMMNKVYALTHVEMLKISSQKFFSIINNFDTLEAHFLYVLKRTESFIRSDVYRENQPLRPVDSRDAVATFDLKKKEISFEDESHFEDPENITELFQSFRYKPKQKRIYIIYPNSWMMLFYTYTAFISIVLVLFAIPIFTMFAGLSRAAFISMGVLDLVWLGIILLTFLVGFLDHEKGDVITNKKFIAKNYLRHSFTFDVLGLIPFEMIPIIVAGSVKKASTSWVLYLRITRYIRVWSFCRYKQVEFGMKNESTRRCFYYMIGFFWLITAITCIFVKITRNPEITVAEDPLHCTTEQLRAVLIALLYVLNFVTSANIPSLTPDTKLELLHFCVSVIVVLYAKGKVVSKILSLVYFRNLSTFNFKSRVTSLENFLTKRETSRILVKSAVNYQTNLFRFSRSESMPTLLERIPMTIRIPLMKDLFIQHLVTCPLFEGMETVFLEQLIARARREVYFPGEMIVEQGDVDHRIYFIHTGEVYIINQTKDRAYVEYVVGRMYAGEYFGEAQGLWFSRPHTYTYRGRTLVEIIVLHSDDWLDLRVAFPKATLKIFEKAKALRLI